MDPCQKTKGFKFKVYKMGKTQFELLLISSRQHVEGCYLIKFVFKTKKGYKLY